jgi:cephalosporin-C deacetylase
MAQFDLPYEQLLRYAPPRDEPADFDAFWQVTLAVAEQHPLDARFVPFDAGLQTLDSFDVTFNGYGGQPIKGWLLLPRGRSAPLPCVVEYLGYGDGRGYVTDWLLWGSLGYAHLVMDTRGQGSAYRQGHTADAEPGGGQPHYPGFLTQGILSPEQYYYRRVYTDAVRAVAAARAHPAIDPHRIAVSGTSQGGGIALAVSGLCPAVQLVMPDVPFLCCFRRAAQHSDQLPYQEIVRYCAVHRSTSEQVFATLAYFDGMQFAARARAEALFSVGLMDEVCPPSTVFAAYNHYAGNKSVRVYPYNGHEGGGSVQVEEKIQWLRVRWRDPRPDWAADPMT